MTIAGDEQFSSQMPLSSSSKRLGENTYDYCRQSSFNIDECRQSSFIPVFSNGKSHLHAMDYHFDFSFFADHWRDLIDGALLTLRMSIATIVFGFLLGVALAVARTEGSPTVRRIVTGYVDVIRNTPLVIQAFWLFFGLAAIQIRVPAMTAAVIALTVNVSAYTTEIVRAGIESIPRGQLEAASCLAFTRWQMLRFVILPQAVERMYPALISQFVLMMLATSIMSQISAEELTAVGYRIQSETFRGFEIYIVIALFYLVMSWLLRLSMAGLGAAFFPRRRRLKTNL